MAEVHLIGQILEAKDFEDQSLFLKWTINTGSSWKILEGFFEGQTQLSSVTKSQNEKIHSWSHPIDVHYVTRGLQGWPRFEFQVWDVDWLGKCKISAYGFMNVPTTPGIHQFECSTWRPVGDFRRRFVDYVTGYRMHLMDPSDIITNGINRQVIQSASMGTIKLELNVILKGFEKYGVDV